MDNSDLHVSCLPEITNNIFCNGSYQLCEMACEILWLSDKTSRHTPRGALDFQNEWLRIKQTGKSFSGTPVDLNLQQTIKADTSSQNFGITSMINLISSRQRWAESYFF